MSSILIDNWTISSYFEHLFTPSKVMPTYSPISCRVTLFNSFNFMG